MQGDYQCLRSSEKIEVGEALMHRMEDNVKRDLRKLLAQGRAHWRPFVKSVVYLVFSKKRRKFLTS
jgi:hypothetical protein